MRHRRRCRRVATVVLALSHMAMLHHHLRLLASRRKVLWWVALVDLPVTSTPLVLLLLLLLLVVAFPPVRTLLRLCLNPVPRRPASTPRHPKPT